MPKEKPEKAKKWLNGVLKTDDQANRRKEEKIESSFLTYQLGCQRSDSKTESS
jgi:hypothetical protein